MTMIRQLKCDGCGKSSSLTVGDRRRHDVWMSIDGPGATLHLCPACERKALAAVGLKRPRGGSKFASLGSGFVRRNIRRKTKVGA